MNHDEARALLPAYALDALSDDERAALRALLADWPDGRRDLAALLAAADALALVPAEQVKPALSLEGRIIARARGERSAQQRQRRARLAFPWWRRRLPHALAAGFAAAAVVFATLHFTDGGTAGGRWLPLDGNGAGSVYVTNYQGLPRSLLFTGIEPAPPGLTYQLWRLQADGSLQPDQTFRLDEQGLAALTLALGEAEGAIVGFAVSLEEPDGRRAGPLRESDVVFAFALD